MAYQNGPEYTAHTIKQKKKQMFRTYNVSGTTLLSGTSEKPLVKKTYITTNKNV